MWGGDGCGGGEVMDASCTGVVEVVLCAGSAAKICGVSLNAN